MIKTKVLEVKEQKPKIWAKMSYTVEGLEYDTDMHTTLTSLSAIKKALIKKALKGKDFKLIIKNILFDYE